MKGKHMIQVSKFRKNISHMIWIILMITIGYVVYREVFVKETTTQHLIDDNKAPNFVLSDVDGEKFDLANYRGKGVLINFWATYCPPCKKEMPYLEKAYSDYKNQGVEVLAVNVEEPLLVVNRFVAEKKLSFPILLDRHGDVAKSYEVLNLPTTFLVNSDGLIVDTVSGEMSEGSIHKYMETIKP